MQLAPTASALQILTAIGSILAILTAAVSVAVAWGRRGAFQEVIEKQQAKLETAFTTAMEHQSEEFERAIQKLEGDRVTNAQLETLVERMEFGFREITREFAGFAGRAGVIGDIEYLKKAMAEGFEIQNRARHDLRAEVQVLNGNLELRVKRCEDKLLMGV